MDIALTLRLLEGQQCATKFVHNVSWTYIANKQPAAKCNILPCTLQNQEINDMTYSTRNTSQIATWVAGQISTFRFSVRHYEIKRISQAKKSSPSCILMCLSRVNLPRYKVYALQYIHVCRCESCSVIHDHALQESCAKYQIDSKDKAKYNRLFSLRVVGVQFPYQNAYWCSCDG